MAECPKVVLGRSFVLSNSLSIQEHENQSVFDILMEVYFFSKFLVVRYFGHEFGFHSFELKICNFLS